MLVHKESKCILSTIAIPRKKKVVSVWATIRRVQDAGYYINPDEWWEVPNKGKLARKINQCWPDFEPVTDPESGELVDIVDIKHRGLSEHRRELNEKKEDERRCAKENAVSRGYTSQYKTLPDEMALGFLHDALQERTRQAARE